jgi:tetratricopeptide (TPR) repeat protein
VKLDEPPLWKELTPIIRAVRQISDLINRSEALAALSVIAFKGGCTEQARRLREEAVNTTAKLENEERSFALSNIALTLARGGQIVAALEVAKPISDSLMRATALSQIARAAAQQKQVDYARHAADQLGECAERCHALVAIGMALYQSEQPNTPAHESTEPSGETPPEPAPVSPAQELVQKAYETAQQLTGFDQVVALAIVSAGWWSIGAFENAQAALDTAIQAAQSLDAVTREQAIQEAACRIAEYGLVAPVEKLLKHLPAERQNSPRAVLVEALGRQGQLEAARAHLAQLRDSRYRTRATLTLAQQRLAQSDYETVSQLTASIPTGVERIQIEAAWALALAQNGQSEEATRRLQQAENAAQHLNDSRQIPEALGIVAAHYLRRGDKEKADALFEQAVRNAQSLGEPWTSALLAKIWLHKAEAVAARLKQEPVAPPK